MANATSRPAAAPTTKVVKIKPVDAGFVRVEMGVSVDEIRIAKTFNPDSLRVVEGDDKKVVYSLCLGNSNGIAAEAVVIEDKASTSNLVFLVKDVRDTIKDNVALANLAKHAPTLVAQIKSAVEAYTALKNSIEVEE